ncbi:type I restriction-modification system endonuclease [Myxococcota bacterium]|nr:type I restriction-modification system endonuclease [Myxococcota bacterium]
MSAPSPNFGFLASHGAQLAKLGADAERFFATDPDVSLIRLRQLGEFLAQHLAAAIGLYRAEQEPQLELIARLESRGVVTPDVAQLFHELRRGGNRSAHEASGSHREALFALKMARQLAVWFHRTLGNASFKAGPFIPPADPSTPKRTSDERARELDAVRAELEKLRAEADTQRSAAERAAAEKAAEAERRLSAEARAKREAEDHAAAMQLLDEIDTQRGSLVAEKLALQQQLAVLQAQATVSPVASVAAVVQQAQAASAKVELDEPATRRIIDAQLRDAGWDADTETLRYALGARPQKGKNLAIAEWPTDDGFADYVLFSGLTALAVVEAKRASKDIPASLQQAKRYSVAFVLHGEAELPAGGPWSKHQVPFLFATNGRPYLRQLETKSGIWFRDARRPENKARALEGWYTPDGLVALLGQDVDAANSALGSEPTDYLRFLRSYQLDAIRAVERAITEGRRECLVAMATGTGKTKTVIALVYRLIKTRRFRRVLFLVDRQALGEQAANAFEDTQVEGLQRFTDIFDLKDLEEPEIESDTKVHIATVQAMVRRLFDDDVTSRPTVDQYDCIVVDECHRGYLLDRQLAFAEFELRSEDDYISTYRRVLDHFDAVKIALTATPAKHTKEIFGTPVFWYKYREAIVDGFLVDHEPPIRIITKLAKDGIKYEAGTEVMVLDPQTSTVATETLPDELDFDVGEFNRTVITEPFNQAVAGALTKWLDLTSDEKTIVFCVDEIHADIVVKVLKAAFEDADDDAIRKITGSVDKPLQAIRHFRNEPNPKVAVTVDLLTTGVDIPAVANLVFLRRVRSRILYEQMIGRATRLSPGKERFRIFDAVDLYKTLAPTSDMQPVVVNPKVTFAQLVEEAQRAANHAEKKLVVEQFIAKLQRKKRSLHGDDLARFEELAKMPPTKLAEVLKEGGPSKGAEWLAANERLAKLLDEATAPVEKRVVSDRPDELEAVERGYGKGSKPKDYLDEFEAYLKSNMNRIPAAIIVATRPRDLTRKDLRDLKLAFDEAGFSEANLDVAWRELKNEDLVASIIGHIRRAAVGDAMLSYDERVDRALKRILASRTWTQPQRNLLDTIARQMKAEIIVDREALDRGVFKTKGGFTRLDKVFDGHLTEVLADLHDALWKDSA